MNLLKNRLNFFLLSIAIILFLVVFFIAISGLFTSPARIPTSPITVPSPVLTKSPSLSPPALRMTSSPTNQGIFTVSFPKAPNPDVFTITLATSPSKPPFITKAVPFTTEFQNAGKLLVITTKESLVSDNIYTLYVRLKSNNHIVVKHRYQNINGALTILDTN